MRIVLVLLSIFLLPSCKKNKKFIDISGDCIVEKYSSNFQLKLSGEIPKKIRIKNLEENPPKELIINREDIYDYIDFQFMYDNLKKQKEENKVVFLDKGIKIVIEKEKFKNKETYKEDDFHGVNYDFPNEIISSLIVFFDTIKIKQIQFKDLAEPNFHLTSAYKIDKENIILEMHNSDGAGGYAAYFFINKSGITKRYIVFP